MPRAERPTISLPSKFLHACHVTFDQESGQFINLPPTWRQILREKKEEPYPDTSKLTESDLSSVKEDAVIRGKSTYPANGSIPDVHVKQDISCKHKSCEDDDQCETLLVDLPPLNSDEHAKSTPQLHGETPRSNRGKPALGRSNSVALLNRHYRQNSVFDSFVRHRSIRRKSNKDVAPSKTADYHALSKHEMSLSLRYGLDHFDNLPSSKCETFSDFVSSESLRQSYNKLFSSRHSIPIPDSNFTIPNEALTISIPIPDSNFAMPNPESNITIPIMDSSRTTPIPDSQSGSTCCNPPNVISDDLYIQTFNQVFETARRMEFLQHIYHNHPPRIPDYTIPYLMYVSDASDFEQCKKAFRTAILHYHPDRRENGSQGTDKPWNKMCVEITKLLNRHYCVFKNITDF